MAVSFTGALVCVVFIHIRTAAAECKVPGTNITLTNNAAYTDCSVKCMCSSGVIGCVPRCAFILPVLPSKHCPNPKRRKDGECCERYFCEDCPVGLWGLKCVTNCGQCAERDPCHIITGECSDVKPRCLKGFNGSTCTEPCAPGRYGADCQHECGGCFGGPTACKPQNGICQSTSPRCTIGYIGELCKPCPVGRWGEDCANNCSNNCARGTLECNNKDGACFGGCAVGYDGLLCEEVTRLSLAVTIGVSVGVIVFVLVGVCVGVFIYRCRHRPKRLDRKDSYLTPCHVRLNEDSPITLTEQVEPYELPTCNETTLRTTTEGMDGYEEPSHVRSEMFSHYETMLPASNWNVDIQHLEMKNKNIVLGNFGEVCQAVWECSPHTDSNILVGLKKITASEWAKEKNNRVIGQIEMLKSLKRCINVLTVLGSSVVPISGDMFLLLEWTDEGNLRDYLHLHRAVKQSNNEIPIDTLVKFCVDVALAMMHLSRNQITHVDLSANTIILDKNLDAKVTGFVHFGDDSDYLDSDYLDAEQTSEDMRWLSIESLIDNIHTEESGVWSLGVLMWEVLSMGCNPYSDISVTDLLEKLQTGCRLGHPARTPTSLYVLMTECWQADPTLRPSFVHIVNRLQDTCNTTPSSPDSTSEGHYLSVA